MIRYNKAFQTHVKGTLEARFKLDERGNPLSGNEDDTTFYFIELRVRSSNNSEISQVAYLLDEATFWEPERESRNRQSDFAEEITSYGDFLVRVEVRMAKERFVQQALLSEMLEVGHPPESRSPAIQEAIDYIRDN